MNTHSDKPKRWRPRFSVRTLVILVTLVCIYAACWRITVDDGCEAVFTHAKERQFLGPNGEEFTLVGQRSWFDNPTAPAPFVVSIGEYTNGLYDAVADQVGEDRFLREVYYFWFFGYTVKLPYERELKQEWSESRTTDFDFDFIQLPRSSSPPASD